MRSARATAAGAALRSRHARPLVAGPPAPSARRRPRPRAACRRGSRARAPRGCVQHRPRTRPRLLPVHRDSRARVRGHGRGAPGARSGGRRVVGEINAACGGCPTCRAGRPSHCERRTVLGIAGRRRRVRRRTCAAGREPAPRSRRHGRRGGRLHRADRRRAGDPQQVAVRPGDRVVVVGAGKLGQLVAQSLAETGCALVGGHARRALRASCCAPAASRRRHSQRSSRGAPTSSSSAPATRRGSRSPASWCARAARSC